MSPVLYHVMIAVYYYIINLQLLSLRLKIGIVLLKQFIGIITPTMKINEKMKILKHMADLYCLYMYMIWIKTNKGDLRAPLLCRKFYFCRYC